MAERVPRLAALGQNDLPDRIETSECVVGKLVLLRLLRQTLGQMIGEPAPGSPG